jgi:hypothetical protein
MVSSLTWIGKFTAGQGFYSELVNLVFQGNQNVIIVCGTYCPQVNILIAPSDDGDCVFASCLSHWRGGLELSGVLVFILRRCGRVVLVIGVGGAQILMVPRSALVANDEERGLGE